MEHTYIIGQSGTGKSTYIKNDILDRIHEGHGAFYLDPHGTDTDDLLNYIPKTRRNDVIVFDPSLTETPMAWNPIANTEPTARPYIASTLVDTIKDAWGYSDMTTPVLDLYLYHTLVTLMEAGETLLGLKFLLTSDKYRNDVLDGITDPVLLDFWHDYTQLTKRDRFDSTASTRNKIGMLIGDPRIRNVIGQPKSAFSFTDILTSKIFFARLPQGKLSIGKTALIGSLLISQAHQAALARTSTVPFHFYIDECHLFSQSALMEMLSGIRKFSCRVVVAHQYLDQLSPKLRSALFGNTAKQVVFRVSKDDADAFTDRFGTDNVYADLNLLPNHTARVFPFDSREGDTDIVPTSHPHYPASSKQIAENMRRNYSKPRESVERAINAFFEKT